MKRLISSCASLCLLVLLNSGCKKNDPKPGGGPSGPDLKFYAVTEDNQLLFLDGKNCSLAEKTIPISGLENAEKLAGIDFRPNTGQLFGMGTAGQIYIINTRTGAATKLGSPVARPGATGSIVGFDFNPTVDRIRVVTAGGGNFRFNPETGALAATDGEINGVSGASVTAVAYTGSVAGSAGTVLFDVDIAADKLYRQDPPNTGNLVEIGQLGVDVTATAGFDISPDGVQAIAAFTVNGKQSLYTINLQTGTASKRGDFQQRILALAIPSTPVAYAIGSGNELLIINPGTGLTSFTKPVIGLQKDEKLLGLDIRPATGGLYALGSSSRIYQINIGTGAATAAGSGPFATPLNGSDFGFDFNPTVDRIRVVSNAGQNLRLHPDFGTLLMEDGAIDAAVYEMTAAAYTNNFSGASTTMLYDIDSKANRLVKQDPPNAGTIVVVGDLGIDVTSANGFDISGTTGTAYGVFTVAGSTRIYTIDLNSGKASAGAALSVPVRGFTLGLGL